MTPSRNDRPEAAAVEIFLDATERPPSERTAFIAGECARLAPDSIEQQDALRARATELLEAHLRAEQEFADDETVRLQIDPRTLTEVPLHDTALLAGATIRGYELLREIAEGGFGTVWLAQQTQPVRRQVAIKVIKAGMDSREVVRRFEAERQALAIMDHPNIARVYDGGSTEQGRPFFVMEYVEGMPITEFCTSRHLDVHQRLELFETVCLAVHHAHERGVVHRDLKPNNVLVTEVDGRPAAKVIDFGIAKAIDIKLTEETLVTFGNQIIGTPAYMSPEQADGSTQVDHRSDIYSLGVLLYEMLVGVPPFAPNIRGVGDLASALDAIRNTPPQKPSTRIRSLEATAPVHARSVRGDIDWIVLCCLEKNARDRYSSAEVLANEIDRHLRREPVLAGPPSLSYRVSRYWKRHRTLLATTSLVVLGLSIATGVAWQQAAHARRAASIAEQETRRAQSELAKSSAMARFLEHVTASISPKVLRGEDSGTLGQTLVNASANIEDFTDEPLAIAAIQKALSEYFLSIRMGRHALSNAEACFDTRMDLLGADAADTLEAQHGLGDILLQLGQTERAATLLEDAIQRQTALHGEDAPECDRIRATYAPALDRLGKHAAAIETLRDVLPRLRSRLGDRAEPTLRVLNNLGSSLEKTGDLQGAEACFLEAFESQRDTHGLEHLPTLKSMTNLARIYTALGRSSEALPLLEDALSVKRTILQPGHPSLLAGLHILSQSLDAQDRGDEAIRLRREGLAMARNELPITDHARLVLEVSGVQDQFRTGDPDAAEAAARLLPAAETTLGEHHKATRYLQKHAAKR